MNKKIAFILLFSMIVNIALPKMSLGSEDLGMLSKLISAQSTLIQICTLSTVPIEIVNNLFAEQNTFVQHLSNTYKKSSKKQDANKSNSASDHFITSAGINNINLKVNNTLSSSLVSFSSVSAVKTIIHDSSGQDEESSFPVNLYIILLFILMLFYALPRGAIDHISTIIRIALYKTDSQLEPVFLLIQNNLLLTQVEKNV